MSPAEKLSGKTRKRKSRLNRAVPWDCAIRGLRKGLNLTLEQVSKETKVSNAILSMIERGTDPCLTTAMALSTFFQRPVEELWRKR